MNLNLEINHKKKIFFEIIVYIYLYLNILQKNVYNNKIKKIENFIKGKFLK